MGAHHNDGLLDGAVSGDDGSEHPLDIEVEEILADPEAAARPWKLDLDCEAGATQRVEIRLSDCGILARKKQLVAMNGVRMRVRFTSAPGLASRASLRTCAGWIGGS